MSFAPGALVVIDRFAIDMVVSGGEFLLTVEPGPTWLETPSCRVRGEEPCVVLEEWTSADGELYYRLLGPRGVGWIHDYYVEAAE